MRPTMTTTTDHKKVIILTGGNQGLGYEALKHLLKHPTPYHIILPVCNLTTSQIAFSKLLIPPHHSIETTTLDLASFASVREFVEWFASKGLKLNVLLLNAGVVNKTLSKTIDGHERTFQINHLSNFLLAHLLLPHLLASGPGSRIVFVNTALHIPGKGMGRGPILTRENLDGSQEYDGILFYRNSKLAQMLCAYQFDQFLEKDIVDGKRTVTIVTLSPGFIPQTGLARESDLFTRFLMQWVMPFLPLPFIRTPEWGGQVLVYAATSSDLENKTAVYINQECEVVKSSDESYDQEKQKTWWNLSCELVDLSDKKIDYYLR